MRKSYYSSASYYSKRRRSPSPISPPPKRREISAPSPISSASNITPREDEVAEELSDPRKAAPTSNFQCQCLRPEDEIIFPGGLPRFVQEGRVKADVSLVVKTSQGVKHEILGKTSDKVAMTAPREAWVEGCRVLLLQGLPEELKIGNSWKNFLAYSGISGVQRAEILSGESFGIANAFTVLDAALLIFSDELSAKKTFLNQEISVYGQTLTVLPDPHFLRTLQLVAAAIFARLPRRSTPTSPATPDDAAPRFGGGLSRRAKVVVAGARHALRLASEAVDEAFWRERGAHSCDCSSQTALVTVRFPRAPQRDACLAYAPVAVRILDVAEVLISLTEAGRVAVVETLAHEDQLFTPLRGELEDVR